MKKISPKKPSLAHKGRGGKHKEVDVISYLDRRQVFLSFWKHAPLGLSAKQNIRSFAVYQASDESHLLGLDELLLITVCPEYDIGIVCGSLLKGRFDYVQIVAMFHRLYRGGDLIGFGPDGFDWSLSPHEKPLHIFVEFLAESLLNARMDNPSWQFMLKLRDRVAFRTIFESSLAMGLDTGWLMWECANAHVSIVEWKRDIIEGKCEEQEMERDQDIDEGCMESNTLDDEPTGFVFIQLEEVALGLGITAVLVPGRRRKTTIPDMWIIEEFDQ